MWLEVAGGEFLIRNERLSSLHIVCTRWLVGSRPGGVCHRPVVRRRCHALAVRARRPAAGGIQDADGDRSVRSLLSRRSRGGSACLDTYVRIRIRTVRCCGRRAGAFFSRWGASSRRPLRCTTTRSYTRGSCSAMEARAVGSSEEEGRCAYVQCVLVPGGMVAGVCTYVHELAFCIERHARGPTRPVGD